MHVPHVIPTSWFLSPLSPQSTHSGIKKTNQARGRQEALVGRMIRSLPDDEQQRIKVGVVVCVCVFVCVFVWLYCYLCVCVLLLVHCAFFVRILVYSCEFVLFVVRTCVYSYNVGVYSYNVGVYSCNVCVYSCVILLNNIHKKHAHHLCRTLLMLHCKADPLPHLQLT